MTLDEFIEECKIGGLDKAKQLLKKFVDDDQPNDFCEGATSRAMCREASNAITGEDFECYIDTKYGPNLYFYMWGGGQI